MAGGGFARSEQGLLPWKHILTSLCPFLLFTSQWFPGGKILFKEKKIRVFF